MILLRKIKQIFDHSTNIRLLILLVAIIVGALLEMLALAIISPFISVLLDDSIVHTNRLIAQTFNFLGFESVGTFLAALTFLLAVLYIFRGVYLFALNYVQFRFIARRQAALSERLLRKIMGMPYTYHTQRNLAELQRIVNTDVVNMFNMG